MSIGVFAAVIAAAVLHASWNALVKSSADKLLNMAAVVLGHLPLAVLALLFVPAPARESWPYIGFGIVLHTFYQLFLIRAYRIGDFTQVYPIARGSAPLLVAVASILFLGVTLQPLEIMSILTIGIGILSMSLVRQSDGQRNTRAAGLALATGGFLASYSVVDGLGARLAGTSLGFFAWLSVGNAALFLLFAARKSPNLVARIAQQAKRTFFVAGSASFVAFSIIIWAFTQAPIALVTALRETSIVFALLIGVFLLKERMDLRKVLSTMMTLLGAALLRMAR